MKDDNRDIISNLEFLEQMAKRHDENERILSIHMLSFARTMCRARSAIEYMSRVIQTYESRDARTTVGKPPIIKDSRHWYCGHCDKRLPMKKNPKYCMKCGTKIRYPRRYVEHEMPL